VASTRFLGQPLVINFWASWCTPCRREFPALHDAYRAGTKAGLAIVGVTYRDIPSDARHFAKDHGGDWTLLIDDAGSVAQAYGVRAIPQTVFVRRDGTVSARVYGTLSARALQLELAKIKG
jgi:peroxiredoxin